MNWDAISSIAEVVGAIGVIVSLIFVGLQIRKSTVANEAATYQASVGFDIDMLMNLSSNADQARIFNAYTWVEENAELTTIDTIRAEYQMTALLRHLENLFLQHQLGMLSEKIWQTRKALLEAVVLSPGYDRFHQTPSARTFDGAFLKYATTLRANRNSG